MSGAAAKLQKADKRLREQWAMLRASWRDDKAREFENEIIQPLVTRIRAAERAMNHLSATLQQVRRDCE